jgi:hypothetical protein
VRRIWGILLAVLLLGGVVVAVVRGQDTGEDSPDRVVVGMIGSEKREFFRDPEVVAALAEHGFEVRVDEVGSWAMENRDLAEYDFAFPASSGPANAMAERAGLATPTLRPFYSPCVVLARATAADVQTEAGLVTRAGPHRGTLDMAAYLAAVREDTVWQQWPGAGSRVGLTGNVFVGTSDPATSNSGALYLAAAAYVAGGSQVVADEAAVAEVLPAVQPLVTLQGAMASTSEGPFDDFMNGVGDQLVWVYESQLAQRLFAGNAPDDVVVLYPDTTVFSDHTLLGVSEDGEALGELLATDPDLRALAVRYGFRPDGAAAEFDRAAAEHDDHLVTDLAAAGVGQAQVPATDVLRSLVQQATGRAPQ